MWSSRRARLKRCGVNIDCIIEIDEESRGGRTVGTKENIGSRDITVEEIFIEVERSMPYVQWILAISIRDEVELPHTNK
jgi:hypothetical protein